MIDNLKSEQLGGVVRRIRRVEATNSLDSASVDNGRATFRGLLSLVIQGSALVSGLLTVAGQLVVSGTQTLTGILTATGTTNLNGPVNIAGTQTVTGVLNVNGPWNLAGTGGITGNVSSTGVWTQTGTYKVNGAGKIIIDGTDPMTLGQTSAGRPGIQFSTGAQVVGTATGAQLTNAAGNGFAYAADTVGLQRGSKSVEVTASGVTVTAPFKVQSLASTPAGTTVFDVVADASGNLYRR